MSSRRNNLRHSLLGATASALLACLFAGQQAAATPLYSQGFESNNAGWNVFGGSLNASRVASGTNGITAASGSYYGLATGGGGITTSGHASSAATNWGGYGFNPGCASSSCGATSFPAGGYTTSLDIYLNMNSGAANDTRFDFTSAISKPDGSFLRDFVFNAGFYNDTDSTGSGPRFVISAGNNALRSNSDPKNPGHDPFTVTSTGWYTFQQHFYDNAGILAVDMNLLNSAGALLNSWTLSNPTDVIATTVGGNRYGWLATNEFSYLAIDNATLDKATVPAPGTLSLIALGLAGVGFARRKRLT